MTHTKQRIALTSENVRTPGEVARQLRVSTATINRWAASGRLVPIIDRNGIRLYAAADVDTLAQELDQ